MTRQIHSGMIVDIVQRKIFPGTVKVENGKIASIVQDDLPKSSHYIMPGFIDAHVHIESSLLIPSEFARLASVHGTVAVVSDPHEIANVLGIEGIRYMLNNGKQVPFHFYFGASSCVPATSFETAGGVITKQDIEALFAIDGLKYLSEMMNVPGVLQKDVEVMDKIAIAHALGKVVDGHAPGLTGADAKAYIKAGISTDHECVELKEALEKIQYGMHILIREGSAARNYAALHPLLRTHPDRVMFCCDDMHPDALIQGHINRLVRRAIIENGHDLMDVLRAASLNAVEHYQLEVGLLQPGDSADFIVVNNLDNFSVLETYVRGALIAKEGKTRMPRVEAGTPNKFWATFKAPKDFIVPSISKHVHVIEAEDGQLITHDAIVPAKIVHHQDVADVARDILKSLPRCPTSDRLHS